MKKEHFNEEQMLNIKFIIALLALVLLLLGTSSCGTKKPIVNTVYQVKVEKEIIRDTVVDIQIKEMFKEVVTKDTISELTTDLAYSKAYLSNGLLYHTLSQSGKVNTKIVYKDKISIDTIYKDQTTTKEVEKKLNWRDKSLINLGYVFLLILNIGTFYLIFKIMHNRFSKK